MFPRPLGWLLAAAIGLGVPALSSADPGVDRAGVDRAAAALTEARATRAALEAKHDELAHRIAALKRLPPSLPLERLLRESVEAERELEAAARREAEARRGLEGAVTERIRALDATLKARKSELAAATGPARVAVAKEMKALLDTRAALARTLERAQPKAAAPTGRFQVGIDPLDGPEELAEKADFIEDARDKIRKKHDEIAKILAELAEEQELARAASNFAADAQLFDEQLRAGRVARQTPAAASDLPEVSARAPTSDANAAPNLKVGEGDAAPADPGFAALPPPADDAPVPFAAESLVGADANRGRAPAAFSTADDASQAAAAPRTGSFQSAPASLAASTPLDPALLLSAKVETLAGGRLSPDGLRRVLADLARAEAELDARAAEIRRRAQRLAEDERKARGIE